MQFVHVGRVKRLADVKIEKSVPQSFTDLLDPGIVPTSAYGFHRGARTLFGFRARVSGTRIPSRSACLNISIGRKSTL
jgi:hypothetical protein